MDGLQDVIFVRMSVHGINQFHTIILLKLLQKNGLNLNIESLNWDDKTGKIILEGLIKKN